MTLKYLLKGIPLIIFTIILTSCIGTRQEDTDLSSDAQIYNISLSAKGDTTRALAGTTFTIDQLKKVIFNRDSLPFLFTVDSAKLNIASSSRSSFGKVVIKLNNPDSSYAWNTRDSIPLPRLKAIETTAADMETTREYLFQLNTHQQDPYILKWTNISKNYLTPLPVHAQKTISLNNRFYTYYRSGASTRGMSSSETDGKNWIAENVTGLPTDVNFKTLFSVNNGTTDVAYAMTTANVLYRTHNGTNWSIVPTNYPLVAVYGKLPSADGSFGMLTAVNDGGTFKFAKTVDFSTLTLMDNVPEGLPITDFSHISIENPEVYAAKYIVISGGKNMHGAFNNQIWLLQENRNEIKDIVIPNQSVISLQNGSIFWYDTNLYLLNAQNINTLYFSENYGLTWTKAAENQALPSDFVHRENPSVITDENNFIWIFGGTSGAQEVVDAWRGRLNKLAVN